MALVILGMLAFRGLSPSGSAIASVQIAVAAAAIYAVIKSLLHVVRPSRVDELSTRKAWTLILLDAILAVGVMSVVDAETTPLAWVALVTPVAEAAIFFSMMSAGLAWLGLSLAFLALQLTTNNSSDATSTTLVLAIQQVLAVLLVAGPLSLMADSAEERIAKLAEERRSADHGSHRLRSVVEGARQMAHDKTIDGVLRIVCESAATLGFDQADIVVRSAQRAPEVVRIEANGQAVNVSPKVLAWLDDGEVVPIFQNDREFGDYLRLAGFRSGYGVAISPPSGSSGSSAVLRVWKEEGGASSPDLRALSLLAGHARETYRATALLNEAEDHAEQLRYEVRHDALTGLANRSFLLETLQERIDAKQPMALLFIDLDGFKAVNDLRGHRAGDDALVEVAKRLLETSRHDEFVGRMGGDEFVLLTPLTRFDTVETLRNYGDEIVESLAEPIEADGSVVDLGASIGVAVHDGELSPDHFISAADTAMYEAKRSGGGTVLSSATAETLERRAAS